MSDLREAIMEAIEANKVGLGASKLARGARSALDNVKLTYSGPGASRQDPASIGVGELAFGRAPEVLEDWAYGFPPWSGKGQTWGLDPEAVDMVGMPLLGGGIAANVGRKSATKALTKALRKEADAPTKPKDISRRKFLKGTGAVAGTAAAAAVMPDILRKGIPSAGEMLAKEAPYAGSRYLRSLEKAEKVIADVVKHSTDRMADLSKHWSPANVSVSKYNVPYDEVLDAEDLIEMYSKKNVQDLYTPEQIEDMRMFLEDLPPDVNKKQALLRVLGDEDADYSKVSRTFDDYGKGIDWTPGGKRTFSDEARLEATTALDEVPRREVDQWIATGVKPKNFPDKHLDYITDEDIWHRGMISKYDEMEGVYLDPRWRLAEMQVKDPIYKQRLQDRFDARWGKDSK